MSATTAGSRKILFLLWAFAFLSYLLRINIAVAQQYIARDLGWNDMQVGYLFTAFLVGYTLFQAPAGFLGDRFGPRAVLTVSALVWAVTTLLTGLIPGLWVKGSAAALIALLGVRFLHGVAEAPTYPVAMNAVAIWFRPSTHAFVNSVIFTGSTLGSAFAPPFVASVMSHYGWRITFYCSALLPLLVAAAWWRQSAGDPTRPGTGKTVPSTRSFRDRAHLLSSRPILLLCSSYLLYCYAISIFVYWLFKYLVDVRHLSIVNSGWATSLPWITASVAVPALGYLSSKISGKVGNLRARRRVATICLLLSALLMSVGATAHNVALALGAISLCVGLLFSTESSFWSTAVELAREDAGAASGVMNLAGNLGGVLSTTLVPLLVLHLGWPYALLSGSVGAVAAAFLWFFIRSVPPASYRNAITL